MIFLFFIIISSLFVGIVASFQFPSVQTQAARYITSYLSGKIGMQISIDRVSINWFGDIVVSRILILDHKDDTLIVADEIKGRFNPLTVYRNKSIILNRVIIDHGDVRIVRQEPDEEFNLNLFVKRIKALSGSPVKNQGKSKFIIQKTEFHNSFFSFSDPYKDSLRNRFNYNQFRLTNITADMGRLESFARRFSLDINALSFIDSATNLTVNSFKCAYEITDTSMSFRKFNLLTGNSHIEGDFSFNYKNQQAFKSFNDRVSIAAMINNSKISSGDLGYFVPYFQNIGKTFDLKGNFNGRIASFDLRDFTFQAGISRITGNLYLNGLPDFKNTFIDIQVRNSILSPPDIELFIPENLRKISGIFGNSTFIGRFTGFPNDFVAFAKFFTQIGDINSDINIKFTGNKNIPNYTGNLFTKNLDIGKLTGNENLLQLLDMNGYIQGKGITLADMDFNLKASIDRIGINQYDYTGIRTDGRLTTKIFEGMLNIGDPNLKLNAIANINLEKNHEKIKVNARLDTAFLQALNLTKKFAYLSTDIDLDFNGLLIDSLTGFMKAKNTNFIYGDNGINIDHLDLLSSKSGSARSFLLESDLIAASVRGNFDYTTVIRNIPTIINEYKLLIRNDSTQIAEYFGQDYTGDTLRYDLKYEVEIRKVNQFLHLFEPDLYIAENNNIAGSIQGCQNTLVTIESDIDSIIYGGITLLGNHLKLNSEKFIHSKEVKANLEFNAITGVSTAKRGSSVLSLAVNWINQKINAHVKINQASRNNNIDLKSTVDLLPNYTLFRFIPIDLTILNEPWDVSQNHYITIRDGEFNIYDLLFFNGEQSVNIYGSVSEDSAKGLNIGINNFRIENINLLLPKDLFGISNGYVRIEKIYDNPRINIGLNIDSLILEKFYIGDIKMNSAWEEGFSRFKTSLDVNQETKNLINIAGYYYPRRRVNQLDLEASLHDANLNILEPFYEDLVTGVEGKANGEFGISGNLDTPVLTGKANISAGKVTLDYLNATYSINGNLLFTPTEIKLEALNLFDRYNNAGVLKGGIVHRGFKNSTYNLKGTFANLNLLNTSERDNSQYYGSAYGTGDLAITGRSSNIHIEVNAKSNSGTRLFIPLNGQSEVHQENFIQFESLIRDKDKTKTAKAKQNKFKGIRLDFNFEITPDAYCEIIFDPTAGDIIRGRGNGKLNLQIDTKGVFNMFGEYEISEGSYNFTLYNIINKAFIIRPGGTITWSGDPYGATMNLAAEYRQLTSLGPLFSAQVPVTNEDFWNDPEVRRKYPSTVILNMKGPLLTPEFDFDIDITDLPQNLNVEGIVFSTAISAFKSEVESDEQELNRQVFSLIVLRKFAEKGSFLSSGNPVGSSVSEFVSNQLSYWITQLDENLEVNLDLGAIDQKTTKTFQLTLSYSLADGRLRITRAGNIYADQTGNDVSNIIGDWTLEYMLTPDGKLRAKMYNKFNYNSLIGTIQGNTTTSAGFSLMHTQGFDRLNEIFTKPKNGKKEKQNSQYLQYNEGIIPSESSDKQLKDGSESY